MTRPTMFDNEGDGTVRDRFVRAPLATSLERRVFADVVVYLAACPEFAFSAYAQPGLSQRLRIELPASYESDPEAYLEQLKSQPAKRTALARALIVRRTTFFGDAAAWERIRESIAPRLFADRAALKSSGMRAWSAGSCTGEEAYSLGMTLQSACRPGDAVRIIGTDIDARSIATARRGCYSNTALADIPDQFHAYLNRAAGPTLAMGDRLRHIVAFSTHDLLMRMPLVSMNLILCRNTIMYFSIEGQARALAKLYLSMTSEGLLVLGAHEVADAGRLFEPVDSTRTAWAKAPGSDNHDALKVLRHVGLRGPIRGELVRC